MSLNIVLEGILVLTTVLWFLMAVRLAFSLPEHRGVWGILVVGLGLLVLAISIDFFGDITGHRGLLFMVKNVFYALGGVLVSAGVVAWSKRTISSLRKVEHMASTDELTGLLNRRGLMRRLEEEFARVQRHGDRLAVMMVDIDDLKVVNDMYGHLAGDRILRAVAESLRVQLRRQDDVIGRFGGDEFLGLIRGADRSAAEKRVEAIREEFGRRAAGLSTPAGISIGVAAYPEDGRNLDDLIDAADHRMYEDKGKSAGRGGSGRAR